MKTFFDIFKNVCVLAHEEIPSSFNDSSQLYMEIKEHIKTTVDEVCLRFPWTFRERVYTFATVEGQKEYDLPSGIEASNIIENGVRIENEAAPLYFIFHNELDRVELFWGKPFRYSVFSSKLILDPAPDKAYALTVKYLTGNFARNGEDEKPNFELADDVAIMPEKLVKIVEWGAYSMYRQNFKPDGKYQTAREKFLQLLIDAQKRDSYGSDAGASILIDRFPHRRDNELNYFFRA